MSSAVLVCPSLSTPYMDMTRQYIGFTFDPGDILISFHICFRFVRAAVACLNLGRTSGFEPSSETTAQRYEGESISDQPNIFPVEIYLFFFDVIAL